MPKKPKPTKPSKKPKKIKTKRPKKQGTNSNIVAFAKTSYVCPVDGTIGQFLTLGRDNRWLCECPRDRHRWYATADLIRA